MNKKNVFLFLVLVVIITGGVFAQEKAANSKSNWISGELSLIGGGVRYERMLGSNMSLGANVYYSTLFFFWNEFATDASFRFYPWGKNFFVGVGFGFHTHTGLSDVTGDDGEVYSEFVQVGGVAITPEVGWKIDVGDVGGFYLQPGVKLPVTFGEKTGLRFSSAEEGSFGVGVGFVPYFGMGFAF
jgi:hypothetical protein